MINPTAQQLGLYIGCQTSEGKLIAIKQNSVYTESHEGVVKEYEISKLGVSFKLLLKKLNTLSHTESNLLITKGFSIGRPNGYSFSPEAILYLASIGVDLFGFIESGYADELEPPNQ